MIAHRFREQMGLRGLRAACSCGWVDDESHESSRAQVLLSRHALHHPAAVFAVDHTALCDADCVPTLTWLGWVHTSSLLGSDEARVGASRR